MEKIQPYLVPLAIVIAGAAIAGAVVFTNSGGSAGPVDTGPDLSETAKNVRPVDATDHVRGNPAAKVTIVEYSDFQCPFCGSFHPTLERVLREYDGQVRWVYRHLPLTQIHPEATPAALASECVAELKGNDAFWKFADGLIKNQSALNTALYEKLAGEQGVALAAFRSCMSTARHQARIDADSENALLSGASGTPFSVLIIEGKDPVAIPGAYPYESVKSSIEEALK